MATFGHVPYVAFRDPGRPLEYPTRVLLFPGLIVCWLDTKKQVLILEKQIKAGIDFKAIKDGYFKPAAGLVISCPKLLMPSPDFL